MRFSFGVQVLYKGEVFPWKCRRFGRCKSESELSCAENEGAPGDQILAHQQGMTPRLLHRHPKGGIPRWERAELPWNFKNHLSSFKAPFLSLAKLEQNKKEAEVSY